MSAQIERPLAERIAILALETFDSLPKKCKPQIHPDGRRDWTILSAVVLEIPSTSLCTENVCRGAENFIDAPALKIVSLATGTKCLPMSAIAKCNGSVLHDSHAEVLAFRGLNAWLLTQMETVLLHGPGSCDVLEISPASELQSHEGPDRTPFQFKSGVSIHLFTSKAPCGDASMELVMASNTSGSDNAWSAEKLKKELDSGVPLGRGYFSHLGVLRRKPARVDAEPNFSMSCSDKIALKQLLGVTNFPVDVLLRKSEECFLKTMVVYEEEYIAEGYQRAFGRNGRLRQVVAQDDSEPVFFKVAILPRNFQRFEFEQSVQVGVKAAPSNNAVLWLAGEDKKAAHMEVLLGGVRQGFKQFEERSKKESAVCRRRLVAKAHAVAILLERQTMMSPPPTLPLLSQAGAYQHLKVAISRPGRKTYKDTFKDKLGGWQSPSMQDDFFIETTDHDSKT